MKVIRILFLAVILSLGSQSAFSQSISWVSLKEAQSKALDSKKKVLIYAEAQWCGYCKKMEQNVFTRPAVQDSLHKYFYPVRLDIESKQNITFAGKKLTKNRLARMFRVTQTPTFIFLNEDGKVMGTQPGYMPPDVFSALLSFVGNSMFERGVDFREYLKQNGISTE